MISLRFNFSSRWGVQSTFKRFFLSNAYKCEEAWAKRLRSPAFQKTDFTSLYHELDLCFHHKKRVSLLDVDLLLNGLEEPYKNELDDILLRIRLCPEAGLLPERAMHAAIRWYIQHASTEDLLNTLSDRLNYGLFPDSYLANILMDKYLKENDPRSAVKIAALQMLQEDFDHPITKALAVHCCYNYLESPEVWKSYKDPEPDPDEEVVKVRVKYLKNPYFDDHFDLTDTNHLVGKTLWLFGRTVDGAIGTSSQLVGLVLYEKYKKCAEFLEEVSKKETKFHTEAVERARKYCLVKPKQVKVESESEEGKDEAKKGEANANQEATESDEPQPEDEWKKKVLELLEKIEKGNLVTGNLLADSTQLVKRAVEENEISDIEHQCQVYEQWEKDREDHIQGEIEKARLAKLKQEIEETKEELQKEEEKLFFFDREEEIQRLVREKEQVKQNLVFYKGKGKHKERADEYIPPIQRKFKTY